MKIYSNLYEGTKRSKGAFGRPTKPICDLRIENKNDVTLVYADVISAWALHPDFAVGIDIPVEGRYMADFKSSQYWCQPEFGDDPTKIPDETQLLIFQNGKGDFRIILPVVGDTYRCVLKGKDDRTVTAKIYSGYEKLCTCKTLAFVTAEGNDPHSLIEKCVITALEAMDSDIPHRKYRKYPEIFEYLGWCSWDAMQIRVTHRGILEKCAEIKEKDIPVRWLLLDDMWAYVRDFYGRTYNSFGEMCEMMHASALYDFEADPVRFPNGLADCINDIKKQGFMAGVWYPTTGYWRGIEKDSPAYDKLKPYLLETDDGIFVPDFLGDKAYGYYGTLNTFLKECGADLIKIDNQSMYHRFYNRLSPIGEASRSFHNGMEKATEEIFGNSMINCMGMSSEDMWNRKASSISRCSDDFQPENKAWFTKHILQCTYNSLLQGQFYWCDWDMWWTDDSQALKNSVARAISGGPIYVSDPIGRSKAGILDRLVMNDGRILRCDNPATPTSDCICADPTTSGNPMKIQNVSKGSGIIALFNLDKDDRAVSGEISPADIIGLEGEEFAVYSHFTKEMKILKRNEKMTVTLENNDAVGLYIFVPYINECAEIGRIDKFISPATVPYAEKGSGIYACVKNRKLYFE